MMHTERFKDGEELKSRPATGSVSEFNRWREHKAKLFKISKIPRTGRDFVQHRAKWYVYARVANAAVLYLGGWEISWRMPWLTEATWGEAWDAGWRAGFGSGHKVAADMLKVSTGDKLRIPEAPRKSGALTVQGVENVHGIEIIEMREGV